MTSSDRRQHARTPLQCYIHSLVKGWHDFAVWGRDIGFGGIGLDLERHVARGDRVIFRLPDGFKIEAVVCNVRWAQETSRCSVGLRWLATSAEAQAALARNFGPSPDDHRMS
jgi:hypothetical protein